MWTFLIGVLAGAIIGFFTAALLASASKTNKEIERYEQQRLKALYDDPDGNRTGANTDTAGGTQGEVE